MRLLFLSIAITLTYSLIGQEVFFSTSSSDLSKHHTYANIITNEENEGFLISIADKKKIKRILVDKQGRSINLLEQITETLKYDSSFKYHATLPEKTIRFYKENKYISGLIQNGIIIEAIRDNFWFNFVFIETDLKTGRQISIDSIPSRAAEKILFCFNKAEKLYIITYKERTDVLNVYTKEPGKPASKNVIDIKISDLGKIKDGFLAGKIDHFYEIFEPENFATYNNNLRYPAMITSVRNKAYFHNDRIFITVNSNDLNTYLIEFDFVKLTYKIKTFDQDYTIEKHSGDATTSSFLIDTFLVTCHVAQKKIHLNIFGIRTEQLIHALQIDKLNINNITSAPVQKTGTFLSKTEVKEEDFTKFYKTALTNEISISGYIDDGKLFLSFAAPYKQFFNGATLLSIVVSAAATYAINASPNTYGYLFVGFRGVQNATFVGFNITLDLPTFSTGKTKANYSVWDRLTSFYSTRQLNANDCNFFYMNNHYYIGSFSQKKDKYSINRFNERGVQD